MSAASVRSNAYRHHIPTKREYGQTYYSKDHFEQLRRTDLVNDDSYYTAREAAEKYGMSTANVGIISKKSNIVTVKVGVKNLNNQAIPVMTGNMSKGICTLCTNNQHYLNITATLRIISAIIQG